MSLIHKDPRERPASAGELLGELSAIRTRLAGGVAAAHDFSQPVPAGPIEAEASAIPRVESERTLRLEMDATLFASETTNVDSDVSSIPPPLYTLDDGTSAQPRDIRVEAENTSSISKGHSAKPKGAFVRSVGAMMVASIVIALGALALWYVTTLALIP
jgi:hypothetical protein